MTKYQQLIDVIGIMGVHQDDILSMYVTKGYNAQIMCNLWLRTGASSDLVQSKYEFKTTSLPTGTEYLRAEFTAYHIDGTQFEMQICLNK
jgi:hypothetical protein